MPLPRRAYQGRKRAKASNILPIMDAQGYIVASTGIIAGHHHDAFNLKAHLQAAFKSMKRLGLVIAGAFFNADVAFNTQPIKRTKSASRPHPQHRREQAQPPSTQTRAQTSVQG